MKTSLKKILSGFFLTSLLLGVSAWGQESHSEATLQKAEKIYISPDQIEVTDHGILLHTGYDENPIVGHSLSYDEHGLYMEILRRMLSC